MLLDGIKFDERYDSEEYETTTLYFIAPKEMLKEGYQDAVSMEISVEFPVGHPESSEVTVMFSPTNDMGEDYDWYDADMCYNDIEDLITIAEKHTNLYECAYLNLE